MVSFKKLFLFSFSVALVVCTRLKLIRNTVGSATTFQYLSNTSFTQLYCTGITHTPLSFSLSLCLSPTWLLKPNAYFLLVQAAFYVWRHTGTGTHPAMPYRGIRPVRQFLQWLKQVDEASMLDRAVVGGYFNYPPLAVSLQNILENRPGDEWENVSKI